MLIIHLHTLCDSIRLCSNTAASYVSKGFDATAGLTDNVCRGAEVFRVSGVRRLSVETHWVILPKQCYTHFSDILDARAVASYTGPLCQTSIL